MASKIVVNLDTSKELYGVFKCKQNDDLTLEANIYENGASKDLTNCSIVVQAKKADNTYIIQNTDITKDKNKFIVNLVRDFTRVPGETKIEVVLTESSKQNTTFSFCLEVIGSVIRGAEESKDLITSLEVMQDAVVEMGKISEETKELIKNSGAASKEEINKVNTQLAENKQQVDVLIPKVDSLASGSPKGTFTTLTALQNDINANTATGKKSIYLVTADGGWYYWSGTVWTRGGTYQAIGIQDKSVTNSKVNDINILKAHMNEVLEFSLFHSEQVKSYSYDIFTGKFNLTALSVDHSGIFFKIDNTKIGEHLYLIVKGLKFTGTSVPVYAWNPSSGSDFVLFKNIVKDGVYKIPKALFTTDRQVLVNVLKGTTVTCENLWVSYNCPEVDNPNFINDINNIKYEIENKITATATSPNLFDKKKVINDCFVNWQNGNITPLEGYCVSEPIEINPLLPYRQYDVKFASQQLVFLGDDLNYISGIQNPSGVYNTGNIPSNAKYIQLTLEKKNLDVLMFYQSESNDIPKYKPYGELLDYKYIINVPEGNKKIVVKKGGGKDYTSLKLAIEEAIKYKETKVYVEEGTYNLIEEFGATFFENFQLGQSVQGIMLCNDVHIIFSPLAKVICHYSGNNLNVEQDFSPFTVKIGNGGFTLEGLNLECSRVRYPIHDEHYGDNIYYKNHYKNCNIIFDSTTKTKNNYNQCIGGGLSKFGDIIIENCIFESKGLTKTTGIVSYHNTYSHNGGGRSEIVIKDSYFAGEYGTVRASYLGQQTDVSICKVIGCSLGKAPFVEGEKDATVVNMKMYAFNNEIRQ